MRNHKRKSHLKFQKAKERLEMLETPTTSCKSKKEDECCAVLGSLVREKMKNPKCKKHLQLEIPELNHEQIEPCGIEKEISMASRLGAKGKFGKVTSIKNKLKKKYTSLRKASKQCRNAPWKTLHKIFNPKVLHAKRRVSKCDTEGIHNVMKSASCSIQLPSKKHNKLYFLTRTLKEACVEYVKLMKKRIREFWFLTHFAKKDQNV